MMSELQGLFCSRCRLPRFLSLLMTPALVNYISPSDQIIYIFEQITNKIKKFFWSPVAVQNFLPEAFYFHLWLFWNPASSKFPGFIVGISTIVLTHRLQTENLFVFLSQQIKKVSVVIFQFLVASCKFKHKKFSKIIFRWGKPYPSWLAAITLYLLLLLLLLSPDLDCSSSPPSQTNCREQQFPQTL